MEQRQPDLLYKNILQSLDMTITHTEQGQDVVSLVNFDTREPEPFTCGGKRLAMCSPAALMQPQWDDLQYFHPLCENAIHGESEVLRTLLRLTALRITTVSLSLLQQLLNIAADKDQHSKLTSKQHVLLTPLANVTDKTPTVLGKLIDKLTLVGDYRFLSLYLKSRGVWKDAEWNRVCTVRFPLFKELVEKPDELVVFGVKIPSKKEKANIVNLIQYLFPNCEAQDQYSYGSNNMTAPQFHALINAYVGLANQLNKTTTLFKKHLDNPDVLLIDTSWVDQLDNLSKWREVYPSMPGNTGDTDTGKPAPVYKASNFGSEVSTVPLAPVGDPNHQQPTTKSDLTPVVKFGEFTVKPNPLGNLGEPLPLQSTGVAVDPNAPRKTADGKIIFGAGPATAPAPVYTGYPGQVPPPGFTGYPGHVSQQPYYQQQPPAIPGWNPPGTPSPYYPSQPAWNQPQAFAPVQHVPFGRL
jgi:hypothetical protein